MTSERVASAFLCSYVSVLHGSEIDNAVESGPLSWQPLRLSS
jgi:hypothetical protein